MLNLIWNVILTFISKMMTWKSSKKRSAGEIVIIPESIKQDIKQDTTDYEHFFFTMGEKYFDNWIYGEPLILDPDIKDIKMIQAFLNGFNSRMAQRGSNDKEKFREKINLLYQLAVLVRNVEGKSPSSTGPAIGRVLLRLRILDGARFDREVLKIKPKD